MGATRLFLFFLHSYKKMLHIGKSFPIIAPNPLLISLIAQYLNAFTTLIFYELWSRWEKYLFFFAEYSVWITNSEIYLI